MKPFLLFLLTLLAAGVALANPKPVRVVWDPPTPEDAPHVEGYNVYQVTITPPLKPTDYAVNLVSPLPSAYSLTATKLNPELIPAGTLEFTIAAARPGMQTIVRAWNSTWGESPDSDILTLRPLPPKPAGLKAVALLIEASQDLLSWAPFAVLEAALGKDEFFRLQIQK
ncbi:MAG: hypothetical protein ACKV19_20980 [Verrucomicrobiales bacterium]